MQWIDFSEYKPINEEPVLVCDKFGRVTVDWYSVPSETKHFSEEKFWINRRQKMLGSYITHWMPFPIGLVSAEIKKGKCHRHEMDRAKKQKTSSQ